MPNRARLLLPVGVERALGYHRELLRLGLRPSDARRWAINPCKIGALKVTRAALLPDGALADRCAASTTSRPTSMR